MKSPAAKECDKRYRERNKERLAEKDRLYYQAHKEEYHRRDTEWRVKNPEKAKAIRTRYRRLHPKRVSATSKRYREKMKLLNPFGRKMAWNLRRRIRRVLKGERRSGKIRELIGCSTEELKLHLVRKFQLGMTFFNYGTVWHVHHIVPCGKFDLTNPDDQRRCFHYTNLMPLFAGQNMRIQP